MKQLLLLLTLPFFLSLPLSGQIDFEQFNGLKCAGPIPPEFSKNLLEKFKGVAQNITTKDRDQKKLEEEFHISSQDFIEDLMTSGRVMYGDPVTIYLQRVLDKVLQDYGATNKNIRVFTVKSPLFNAAATNDGIVYVNLGLMAQVENEAQLAFILAHEIIHSEEDHVLEGFLEKSDDTQTLEGFDDGTSQERKLIALRNFSKSLEFEADREAFTRFMLNSGYDPFEAVRVMDVMLYSYLPFDEVPFSFDFFNNNAFRLSKTLALAEVQAVTAIEDYKDELSTHPNLRLRKDSIISLFAAQSIEDGKLFIVDEQAFLQAQKAARYELPALHLFEREYPEAIYNSFLLLQKDPNNLYLRKNLAIALHTFSMYKNNKNINFMGKVEKVEGNLQSVYHLLKEISSLDMGIWAAQYAYQLAKDFPQDPFAQHLFNRSMEELVFFHELKSDYLFKELATKTETEVAQETKQETEEASENQNTTARRGRSSKVEVLKKQRDTMEQTDSIRMAFVGEFDNPLFKEVYNRHMDSLYHAKSKQDYITLERRRYLQSNLKEGSYQTNIRFKAAEAKRREKAERVDRVVLVMPEVTQLDKATRQKSLAIKDLQKSASQLATTQAHYLEYLDKANIKYEVLDFKSMDTADAESFNQLLFARSWFTEYLRHPGFEYMVSLERDSEAFEKTFKTPYMLLTGVVKVPAGSKIFGSIATVGAFIGYPPLGLPYLFTTLTPKFEMLVYTLILDVRTGTLVYERRDTMKRASGQAAINVINYANIMNINAF